MGRLGEEVSEKIKSAVRAKLMELGIHMEVLWNLGKIENRDALKKYFQSIDNFANLIPQTLVIIGADNELPDYVMVLVANKKTQKQMEQDLHLFLGSSTVIFTTWLHNVLKRLEQVTVSSKGVRKKTDEKKLKSKKRLSSDNDDDERKSAKKVKNQVKVESSPEEELLVEPINLVEIKKEPEPVSDDENDYLNLRADTDSEELGESLDNFPESGPINILSLKAENSTSDLSVVHSINSKDNDEKVSPPKVSSEEQVTKKIMPIERPKERVKITWDCDNKKSNENKSEKLIESEDSNSRSSNKSQERQRPGRRRSIDQEPSGSSIVMIKSAVRDIKESQNSTGKSTKLTREPEKPSIALDKLKKHPKDDQEKKTVIYDARDIIRRKCSGKRNSPERISERPAKEGSEPAEKKKQLPSISKLVVHERGAGKPPDVKLPSLVKVSPRPVRRTGIQANYKLILRAVADAEKSVATAKNTSKLKSPERNIITKRKDSLGYIPPAKISITLPNDRVPATKDAESEMPPQIVEKMVEMNVMECESDSEIQPKTEVEKLGKNSETSYMRYKSMSRSQEEVDSSPQRGSSSDFEPEFLITLGNDMASDLYGMEGELDWGEDAEPEDKSPVERRVLADSPVPSVTGNQRVVYSKTPFNRSRLGPPPAVAAVRPIQKISERIAEIDGITVDVDTATTNKVVQLKLMKRCKFWPNCAAGDKCIFHHPETLCRSFPNCTYGDQCIYVHPSCKFGDKCLNVNCPFLHGVVAPKKGRQPLPLSIPRSEQCIFYPNCTNKLCRFQHPKKLCKFGLKCTNWGCEFDHSKALLPSKDQLTWTPSKR